jgi:PhoU domain
MKRNQPNGGGATDPPSSYRLTSSYTATPAASPPSNRPGVDAPPAARSRPAAETVGSLSTAGSRNGRRAPTDPLSAVVVANRGEPPEHLFRRLLGAYLAGAREFAIRERPALRAPTREVVRSFCRRTRQPEIVSDEGSLLRLQDLAYESPIPVGQRVARMGRLVVDFHREAVESWTRLPFGEDGSWERRDDEVDREAWYLQRVVTIRVNEGNAGADALGYWTVARSLERIADHASVLGEAGRRLVDLPQGSGPLVSLRQYHAQAMEHLEGVLSAETGNAANDLLDVGEALLASGRSLADRLLPAVNGYTMPPATAAAVARILESIGRTVAYAQDIGQVALDRSLPADAVDLRPASLRLALSPGS